MRTETVKVFKFEELSNPAKENAREWYRQASAGDSFYAECTIEDAKEIASLMGIEIDKIYYSGFSSQGDGASYTGHYQYKKGALQAVKSYASQDTELHRIAAELQDIQRKSFYGLNCRIRQSGFYHHEMTMHFDIDIEIDQQSYDGMEHDIAEALRDYARWIYKRLEESYEWENSDEIVSENIMANEYEFTEDGSIY